jgi:hypothetical protein
LYLDSKAIKVFGDNDFFIKHPENLKIVKTGYRVLLELCYQSTVTNYGVENDKTKLELKLASNKYNVTKTHYEMMIDTGQDREKTYRAKEKMELAYKNYIAELELELERQGGIEGELVES